MGSPTPVSRKRAFTAESSSSGYAGVDLPELSPAINRASKPKLSKQDELHISMDRLSVLPDDIVFHILSFLPTKNSIRTSLLAKRWRYLWAHLPCFGFTKITTDYNQITPLHNLVNAFLIGVGTSNNEFESWIETLLQRKVRDLVIGLNYQLKLPRRLFTCESLVYLRILDCGYIPKDGAVSFPSLKKLELINVVYDFEDPLIHLLSRCPVLEELMIERMKVLYCNVSSPSLTSLVIDVDEVGWIRLQTPSLRYLRLRDPACESIKAGPMTSLIEADIDIKLDGRIIYSRCLIDFVNSLCNVECLKLSTCPMDDKTPFFSDEVVKFHNLTHLNLRTDWRFVAGFLENANNLRVLTILRMDGYKTQCWKEPKQVPECLTTQHLESVSIVDFGWSAKHEFDFVKYILKDAIVLKKMDIVVGSRHYEVDSNAKRESMNRLLRRSRLLR